MEEELANCMIIKVKCIVDVIDECFVMVEFIVDIFFVEEGMVSGCIIKFWFENE